MAASYRSFGTYPNVRNEVVGTWADILASGANDGDFAMPTDAWGCSAEWKTGAGWTGFIGEFTSESALVALGATGFGPGATARVSGNSWNYGIGSGTWGATSPVPSLAVEQITALGSSARIGVVDGTVYAWSETLGRHVPGVPMSTDVYDSYLDLVADRPVGDFIGQRFKVKCFLGDSYYDAEWSGTRWGIPRYECPVRLDAKIPIVSTSGNYARAAVAAIGPLIGDYETWEFAAMARNTGTHSGSGALIVNTTGNTTPIGSSSPIGTVNTRARRVGILRRIGNDLIRMSGFGLSFSSASTAADIVVANWSAFEIECGMQTFAVGDTYSIEEFIARRIA